MKLSLHANATTTPRTRAYIQASTASVAALARELGVSETTIRRWRGRATQHDGSHVRHNLGQSTTPEQEALIAVLRRDARLSADDITEVMGRCLPPRLSRSAVYRCLKRMGLSARLKPDAPREPGAQFDPVSFGYVHVDLKYLGKLRSRAQFAFVAIERISRFAHIEVLDDRKAETVARAMERFLLAFGHPIHTVLSDNGAEFTDRFQDGNKAGHAARPSGGHPFDVLCKRHAIRHILTRPYRPQTNGMVERFNRRIGEALRALPPARDNCRGARFFDRPNRTAFIEAFVRDYNRTRLRCLKYRAPLDVIANQLEHNTREGAALRAPLARRPASPRPVFF